MMARGCESANDFAPILAIWVGGVFGRTVRMRLLRTKKEPPGTDGSSSEVALAIVPTF